MADQPILKVPVTVDEEGSVDAFLAKLAQAREALKDIPMQWGGHGPSSATPASQGGGPNAGIVSKAPGKGAQPAPKTVFDQFKDASNDPKASGSSSFIGRFQKASVFIRQDWQKISKEIELSTKGLTGLTRASLNLGGAGGLFGLLGAGGVLGGLVAGVGAASINAAAGLSDQNRVNRMLGVKSGESQAFENVFGNSVGLHPDYLGNIADLQSDQNQWYKLQRLGISQTDIQGKDPAELGIEAAQKAADIYSLHGGTYAANMGVYDVVPQASVRAEASLTPDQRDSQYTDYQAAKSKLAVDQDVLDKSTKAITAWDNAIDHIKQEFDIALEPLAPKFTELGDKVGDVIHTFAESGQLQRDVEAIDHGLVEFGKGIVWINDKLLWLEHIRAGNITHTDAEKQAQQTAENDKKWLDSDHKFGTLTHDPNAGFWPWDKKQPDDTTSSGGGGTGASDGSPYSKLMDAIKMNESSGINGQTNKQSGAAGLYGISVDNARAMGIDPMDPVASRKAAEHIYGKFYEHFHDFAKAAAAYDGDTHIDEDSKKYDGDWLKGAKPETINYLKKLELQGQGLDLTPAQQAEIDRLTTVKKEIDSPQTAPNAAGTGGGYDFSMPRPAMNPQMAPINFGVTVSAPAGSNVGVIVGGAPR